MVLWYYVIILLYYYIIILLYYYIILLLYYIFSLLQPEYYYDKGLAAVITSRVAEAVSGAMSGSTNAIQSQVHAKVDEWFKAQMVPLIVKERAQSLREETFTYIERLQRAKEMNLQTLKRQQGA